MKRKRIWKGLAFAGSLAVLAGGRPAFLSQAARTVPVQELSGQEYQVPGRGECRRLLMELVSSAGEPGRYEVTVTGEDFEPESLVIAQVFPEVINISNTKLSEERADGHTYTTCRIGFEISGTEEADAQEEESGDLETLSEGTWAEGDIRLVRIGEKLYRFRCIDDDYRDRGSYDQRNALFLCETVIRSDIDSTDTQRKVLLFGEDNNYKTSEIRKWLLANAEADGAAAVETGVNSAYLGKTEENAFGELTARGLAAYTLPEQYITDQMFLLSVEEALTYREELFAVSGGESAFDRGYWLRTPVYEESETGEFQYGTREYVVDLKTGCIRPAEVTSGEIGIRPAFCLPQA